LPLEPVEYEESQPRSHALAWERDVQPLCGEWHVTLSVESVPYSWE